MKKTKIICTMGPNTNDRNVMMELAKNGMDVARFNFSHGDYEEHQGRLELLKEVRKELDIPVAALLDTKGPEIRTGQLKDGRKVTLKEGQTYTLTTRQLIGDENIGYINYSGLGEDVVPGNKILIDDGLIEMDVMEVNGTDIVCKVINGGELGEKKGVNVPNVKIKLPALTDKDKEDIRFGIKQGFDFIAASFVRTADCIREIKAMLDEQGSSMKVIAKIENARANAEKLLDVSAGNFHPVPKVASAVVGIIPHGGVREVYKDAPDDIAKFTEDVVDVISLAFGQRRKTFLNAVSGKYPKDKTQAVLEELGIRPDVRGEVLSAEDFCRITDKLRKK